MLPTYQQSRLLHSLSRSICYVISLRLLFVFFLFGLRRHAARGLPPNTQTNQYNGMLIDAKKGMTYPLFPISVPFTSRTLLPLWLSQCHFVSMTSLRHCSLKRSCYSWCLRLPIQRLLQHNTDRRWQCDLSFLR